MAKKKKTKSKNAPLSKGQIINRKTKDFKDRAVDEPYQVSNKSFNPLRPKMRPNQHTGQLESPSKMTDTQRLKAGIGTPMGHFEPKQLNPRNDKDAKEIKKGFDYLYTHTTNPNFDRTRDRGKYNDNYSAIDWGKGKKERKSDGGKYKKKYG